MQPVYLSLKILLIISANWRQKFTNQIIRKSSLKQKKKKSGDEAVKQENISL